METQEEVKETVLNDTTPQVDTKVPDTKPENQDEINWRKFREQREIERKEAEAAKKRAAEKEAEAQALKAAMEAILNKPQRQAQVDSYSPEGEESEDERISKKIEAAIAMREQAMDAERKRREQAEMPQRLNQTFNDFNQVCTADNLDYLEYHYPEVAQAFKYMPESVEKWTAVYKAVKRFIPNTENKKEQRKAEANFNKPQSMATPGKTETGDSAPMQLDEKRRADNWNRMQRVMKGG